MDTNGSSPRKCRLSRQSSRTGINLAVRVNESSGSTTTAPVPTELVIAYVEQYVTRNPQREVVPAGVPIELHNEMHNVWSVYCSQTKPTLTPESPNPSTSGGSQFELGTFEDPVEALQTRESAMREADPSNSGIWDGHESEGHSSHTDNTTEHETPRSGDLDSATTNRDNNGAHHPSPTTFSQALYTSSQASQSPATGVQLPKGYDDLSHYKKHAFWRTQETTIDFSSPSSSSSGQFAVGSAFTFGGNALAAGPSSTFAQPKPPAGSNGSPTKPQEKHLFPLLGSSPQVHNVVATDKDLMKTLDKYTSRPENKRGLPIYINGIHTTADRRKQLSKGLYDYRLMKRIEEGHMNDAVIKKMFLLNNPALAGQASSSTGATTSPPTSTTTTTTTTASTSNSAAARSKIKMHICGWETGPSKKCSAFVPLDNKALQLHFEIFHEDARAWSEEDTGTCKWGPCGRRTLGKNLVKHIKAHHMGDKAKSRVCNVKECVAVSKGNEKCDTHKAQA